MNSNDMNNSTNTYRATGNLNTAIEDVNANNINSATDVNILGTDYSDGNNTYQDMSIYNNSQSTDMNGFNTNSFIPNNQDTVNNDGSMVHESNQFINKPLSYDDVNRTNAFIGGSSGINPQDITNSSADVYMGEDAIQADNSKKNVRYEPIMETKKKPDKEEASRLAKEGMLVIIMALILVVFVIAMPYIYDFFRDVKLAFINR